MMRLVVDSSIAVPWFLGEREPLAPEARELLEQHVRGEVLLCGPEMLVLEVLNAARCRDADPVMLDWIASQLNALELGFTSDRLLAQRAAVIAATYGISVYDAAFAALAEHLDCELVTADRRLAECGACRVRLL